MYIHSNPTISRHQYLSLSLSPLDALWIASFRLRELSGRSLQQPSSILEKILLPTISTQKRNQMVSPTEDMISVLSTLMSSDNSQRKQAEAYYNSQLIDNLMTTLESLITILTTTNLDLVIRSMAGVLLRRAIERTAKSLEERQILMIRSALIQMWTAETNTLLLKRLAHVLAQSAAESPWAELLPSVINHANGISSKPRLLSSLNLVETLAEYCPDDIFSNLPLIGNFMATMICNPDDSIQVACARSVGACIVAMDDDAARNIFKPALLPIINVLGGALTRGDESDAVSIIESLITVAQIQPIFFKGTIDNVVAAMLTVALSESLEFPTRSLAVELILTFTETAPALARRCAGLVEGLIPLCMALALEVDDDEADWIQGKYTEEPADENNCVGEEAIERAAAGMGGRVVTQPVITIVQQYAMRPEWQYRRAAVAGLSRLAEGATDYFKQYLAQAVPLIRQALNDSSPRVKFEAIQTIGRFAFLFPSSIADLVETFLPPLTLLLGNASTCDKVRGHAASAMINLVNPESCEAEALTTHLEPLLTALVVCLQSAAIEVQPHCLVLLGCAAQVAEEAFIPYYSSFMPGIKAILKTATSSDRRTLRGKAMECAGLVGEAVGSVIFSRDALEIMQLLIEAIGEDDDTTFDYILPACGRISKALQHNFEPFLPLVMPALLVGATQEIHFSMVDAEEDDTEGEVIRDDDAGTESAVISLGSGVRKRVTLNTHAVQQKNQAARMLYEFGSSMKGYMKVYLAPSLMALLTMVTDKHSADIRSSSIMALAKLFEAHVHATQMGFIRASDLSTVLTMCVDKLMESLKGEISATPRACAAEALRDILAACYASGSEQENGSFKEFLCMPTEAVALKVAKDLLKRSSECLARRKEKESAFNKNEGLDADDKITFSEELEEEEELLTNIVDALGQLLKLFSTSFMPVFDSLVVPAFAPFLAEGQPPALQIVAVCLIDDAIEFGGEGSLKYIPQALTAFSRGMLSEELVLRQSSVYGIAQAARMAPQLVAPFLSTLIPHLMALVTDPSAGEEDNEGVTENGLFAIGTILSNPAYRTYSWGGVLPAQVASVWLRGLPLKADVQEAKLAHAQLCSLAERGDASVLGDDHCNLSELMRIFSLALLAADKEAEKKDDDIVLLTHPITLQRIRSLARQYTQELDIQQLKAVYGHLPDDQQRVLQ